MHFEFPKRIYSESTGSVCKTRHQDLKNISYYGEINFLKLLPPTLGFDFFFFKENLLQ